MENMVIVSTRLEPKGTWMGRVAEYEVHATTEDGIEHTMFRFYTDEKRYTESSFVGLTLKGAREKFTQDDIAYLQS